MYGLNLCAITPATPAWWFELDERKRIVCHFINHDFVPCWLQLGAGSSLFLFATCLLAAIGLCNIIGQGTGHGRCLEKSTVVI